MEQKRLKKASTLHISERKIKSTSGEETWEVIQNLAWRRIGEARLSFIKRKERSANGVIDPSDFVKIL